jgi:hypothetical protein
VSDDFARLAYEAALRALDKQEELLTEIRARTGLLLGASSLAASFVGATAFGRGSPAIVVLAVVAFGFTVGAGLYVLVPKDDLVFAMSGAGLYEGLYPFQNDMAEVYRRLAYDLDRYWDANDRILAPLFIWFRCAGVALAAEVVLLLVAVSGKLVVGIR